MVATAVVASVAALVSALCAAVAAKFVAEVLLWHHVHSILCSVPQVFCKHFLSPPADMTPLPSRPLTTIGQIVPKAEISVALIESFICRRTFI